MSSSRTECLLGNTSPWNRREDGFCLTYGNDKQISVSHDVITPGKTRFVTRSPTPKVLLAPYLEQECLECLGIFLSFRFSFKVPIPPYVVPSNRPRVSSGNDQDA